MSLAGATGLAKSQEDHMVTDPTERLGDELGLLIDK
jgi:hypothetical protein